jgi:hypothetical protein
MSGNVQLPGTDDGPTEVIPLFSGTLLLQLQATVDAPRRVFDQIFFVDASSLARLDAIQIASGAEKTSGTRAFRSPSRFCGFPMLPRPASAPARSMQSGAAQQRSSARGEFYFAALAKGCG